MLRWSYVPSVIVRVHDDRVFFRFDLVNRTNVEVIERFLALNRLPFVLDAMHFSLEPFKLFRIGLLIHNRDIVRITILARQIPEHGFYSADAVDIVEVEYIFIFKSRW